MNILPTIEQRIQEDILPLVKPKWKPMFRLGINALSLSPFNSLSGNARVSRKNSKAAMMQMYRLVRKNLVSIFSKIMLQFFNINDKSIINIDFCIFHPFAVLCLGLQTKKGRSIPVWIDIIKYPIKKDSQNIFILKSLERFLRIVKCKPQIVCDRGFIGKYLIHGFVNLGLIFYIRMKAGKTMIYKGKKYLITKKMKDIFWLDVTGEIYKLRLRTVRSSQSLRKRLKLKECWYIITNNFELSRQEILNNYYYRFEIEETFKDIKHVFNTKPRYFQKTNTLLVLLWFQILGIWLLWHINQKLKLIKKYLIPPHPKKQFSWIKQSFEIIFQERLRPLIPVYNFTKWR